MQSKGFVSNHAYRVEVLAGHHADVVEVLLRCSSHGKGRASFCDKVNLILANEITPHLFKLLRNQDPAADEELYVRWLQWGCPALAWAWPWTGLGAGLGLGLALARLWAWEARMDVRDGGREEGGQTRAGEGRRGVAVASHRDESYAVDAEIDKHRLESV